jgi:hypothetical protein
MCQYSIPSNLEEIRNWRRSLEQMALNIYATGVSVLARIRRDKLDSLFLMLMTEMMSLFAKLIRVWVRVRVQIHAKKIPIPVSVVLQMTKWTCQFGWIGIKFGQATENYVDQQSITILVYTEGKNK